MSGQQVAQTFGPNMPTRIAGSAQLVLEPGEVAPVPMYQPLVPFLGSQVVTGASTSSSSVDSGSDDWKSYPDKLNLLLYQGDDVQIPLYFQETRDMSDDAWEAEVRLIHRYTSTLVYEFTITSEFLPAAGDLPAMTLVTLFLPRLLNKYIGSFRWELASASPYSGPTFPPPLGVEPEEWPPLDQVKTWLYGTVSVMPRLTATDELFLEDTFVPGQGGAVVTSMGITVGPNGRVP